MRRNNFLLLLIYLLFFNSLNADIKVVKKIRLKVVDIDKDSPSKVFYIDPRQLKFTKVIMENLS